MELLTPALQASRVGRSACDLFRPAPMLTSDSVGRVVAFIYHRHMSMKALRGVAPDACQLETAGLSPAASLFRSLADPTRLVILRHLSLGEHRVIELTKHLGLAQSTVSKHLACLRDCGLVESRPLGRASMFSLTTRDELLELLAAAEQLLALTGDAVDLCPTFGADSHKEARN